MRPFATFRIAGLADARLTQSIARGRAGDVALSHQRIENDQQIEVNRSQIPFGYDIHISLSFPRRRGFRHYRLAATAVHPCDQWFTSY